MEHIRTGDVLLFSSNKPNAFLSRLFQATRWNHVGIAVRITPDQQGNYKNVSLDGTGELFVLETNTGKRYDHVHKKEIRGAGFSPFAWVASIYDNIDVRPMREHIRRDIGNTFGIKTLEYARLTLGTNFPTDTSRVLSLWMGVSLRVISPLKNCKTVLESEAVKETASLRHAQAHDKKDLYENVRTPEEFPTDPSCRIRTKETMFCSEFIARYYVYTTGSFFKTSAGHIPTLQDLLGVDVSKYSLVNPACYSLERSNNSVLFENEQQTVIEGDVEVLRIILPVLLFTIVMAVLILHTLRSN